MSLLGKLKASASASTRLNQIQIQQSSAGLCLGVGWGQTRIGGKLLDAEDFKAHAHKESGGKGGAPSSTSYTYSATILIGLSEGTVISIPTIWIDNSTYVSGSTSALSQAGFSAFFTGTISQSPWSYMTTNHPTRALAYSETAYAAAVNYDLGSSGTVPNHNFEVVFGFQNVSGKLDASPFDILPDALGSTQYGLWGWTSAYNGDWTQAESYVVAAGLLVSPWLDQQQDFRTFFDELMAVANCGACFTEGVLKIQPYGDTAITGNGVTYTPNFTPEYDLGDGDFLDEDQPVRVTVTRLSDAWNSVDVQFTDRSNAYNVGVASAEDQGVIDSFGRRKDSPHQHNMINDSVVARTVAALELQRAVYIRATYEFEVPAVKYDRLEPLDYVTLTSTKAGLVRVLVRLTAIEEDESSGGTLKCSAEQTLIGTANPPLFTSGSGSGVGPNMNVDPGSISAPFIFNAPTSITTGGEGEVWMAVASTNVNWGGAYVYASFDGTTYSQIGIISSAARYGVTTATFASGSDPDTTNTLSVDLSTSLGVLTSAPQATADADGSLCLVGNELVDFTTATLTTTSHYNLTTYLRRGRFTTSIASHASSSNFVRLDDSIFKYVYPPAQVGSVLHLKFASFNIYGQAVQDLSVCTDYTITMGANVIPPDGVTGLAQVAWLTDLQLAWAASDRAATYTLDIYDVTGVTHIRSVTGITGTTYTYTSLMGAADGVLRGYQIKVTPVNTGGNGASQTITVTNPAPTAVAITGTTNGSASAAATATCGASTATDLSGYVFYVSTTTGFTPYSQGSPYPVGLTTAQFYGLAAGTYYVLAAAVDFWSSDPRLLNFSSQSSFTVSAPTTSGGGGTQPGGGGGYAGGGKGTQVP